MKPRLSTMALALAGTLFLSHSAIAAPAVATKDEAAAYDLMMNLKSKYPDTPITSVKPSPLIGLYEVVMGKSISYTDINGDNFVFGKVYNMETQEDLTQPRLDELNKIDVSRLNKDWAIKRVHGNGESTLYVFSDPDCPYCQRLEQTLLDVKNVTIYLFPMPLAQLHPEAHGISESIWCSKNKASAWEDYMLKQKKPAEAKCKNPISNVLKLAEEFGIRGTPTLINAKGVLKPGALPLGQIQNFIQ